MAATCRAFRELVHSESSLWADVVVTPSHAVLPAHSLPALQRCIERQAHLAVCLSIYGDQPERGHLYRVTWAAKNIQALDLHHVCQPSTAEEVSRGLAASGAQPTSARACLCAVAAQLPSSVQSLELEPAHIQTGWVFYQTVNLDDLQRPASVAWLLHRCSSYFPQMSCRVSADQLRCRFWNLCHLRHLVIRLPKCWVRQY